MTVDSISTSSQSPRAARTPAAGSAVRGQHVAHVTRCTWRSLHSSRRRPRPVAYFCRPPRRAVRAGAFLTTLGFRPETARPGRAAASGAARRWRHLPRLGALFSRGRILPGSSGARQVRAGSGRGGDRSRGRDATGTGPAERRVQTDLR